MGAFNFIIVLKGLIFNNIQRKNDEKIRIIIITHPAKYVNNFSYAILLPLSSIFSDVSKWWIFYRCATDMPLETMSRDMINKMLESYEKYLHIDKIEVKSDELQDYLRSDYVKHIENKTEEVIVINSAMRGALLELLVSNYFWKLGQSVIIGHRTRFIKKELDVISIDEENKVINIIECKEKSITVDPDEFDLLANQLMNKIRAKEELTEFGISHNEITINQLNDFITLINNIINNYTSLLDELKLPNKGYTINGIMITTELYEKNNISLPEGIEFWTWWNTRDKILSVEINRRYLDIIEQHMKSSLSALKNPHFMQDFF